MERYKALPRRKAYHAPLHVPIPAFHDMADLQRSRVNSFMGMSYFHRVSMDARFYEEVAGWTSPHVDAGPVDKKKREHF